MEGKIFAISMLECACVYCFWADIMCFEQSGNTALMGAAYHGCVEVVDVLVQAGCNIERQDKVSE
jgi:hypothetical protein